MLRKSFGISISIFVLMGTLFMGNSKAQDGETAKLKVMIMVFSGRPDPVYYIEKEELKNVVKTLLSRAEKAAVRSEADSTVIPNHLGYRGIMVDNQDGEVSDFPHFLAVYMGNIEVRDEQASYILTYTERSLEHFLLNQALERGATDESVFNLIADEAFGTVGEGVVQGDINNDGKIGLEEAVYALQTVAGLEAIPLPHRMKGYQLFSWSEENEWHFTLIYGTNRTKTFEEIMSGEDITDELGYAKITVRGADSIKAVMSKLPTGESVFWAGRSYPWVDGNQDEWPEITHPDIENIKTHCSQLGLELTVYPNPDTPR
ncbi:MAG: hypothetical protein GY795_11015 [Desulfobacterales bacterium]|nr:hypothetical protein [Desulfobacterales bacterium]